tara:strand:- start:1970 stop:2548 length:579 start_codon:yes stop_codon:yes gene_type:complete
MAFQVGSRVRPELGDADFSGFVKAAEIQANTLAQLGATIGGAIQERAEKKKEKALTKQAKQTLFGMVKNKPELANFFGLPEDFTLDDMTPFVDVMGAKPALALITQLNMASMKAGQTERPTISDLTKLREFLPGDKVIEDGRIVDTTFRNEVLPVSDPLVQQLLQTDVGRSQLYGYAPVELVSTTTEDEEAE